MGQPVDRGSHGCVEPIEEPAADWRDAAAYAPLLEADRSIFAWEWLRRDPAYQAASTAMPDGSGDSGVALPTHWGLHAFEAPGRAALDARPVWRAELYPLVLAASAVAPGAPADAFDLARFGTMATIVRAVAGPEHLLLSDGLRSVRIDVLDGTLTDGPVELHYLLGGFGSAQRPLLTLRRLLALHQTGRFSRALHGGSTRARRWVLMLRAYDGLAGGADQREIAAVLLSRAAHEPRWRSRASSLRSQAQRLVRGARCMAAGGYRELLR